MSGGVSYWPVNGGSGAVEVDDNGVLIVTAATKLNFTGTGVTVTDAGGGQADIAVPGAVQGDLTDVGTDGITITGGTNAVFGAGTTISQHVADATHNGYLSSVDWSTFNNKQSALTIGNLTDVGTDGITVTGGTGSVIGTGTSISQQVADTTHNGYLSSADWNTFNSKQAALTIGDFTDVGTDGITVTNGTGSVIGTGTSISQHVADATHNGYLSSTDFVSFTNKWSLTGNAGTTAGTNFVGTTDAVDLVLARNSVEIARLASGGLIAPTVAGSTSASGALILTSTTNATKGTVNLGQSYREIANGKVALGTGAASATTANAPLHIKANAAEQGLVIEESGGAFGSSSIQYGLYPYGSLTSSESLYFGRVDSINGLPFSNGGMYISKYGVGGNGNNIIMFANQGLNLQNVAPANFYFMVAGGSAATNTLAPSANSGTWAMRNGTPSANNYSGFVYENSSGVTTGGIFGVHESITVSTGHIEIITGNAGTLQKSLIVGSDGTLTAVKYGTGVLHSDSAGVISSSTIATADIANSAVTYAKIQNVSATDKVLGRQTAGAGVVEEITCTSAGRALIAGASASAQRTTLGLVIGTDVLAFSGTGLVESLPGMIEAPTNKTYVLDQSAAYAYTINTLIIATVSGTITAAVKINGTNVTGISAVSVSSTPATGTASAANSVAIGDKVTLVLSANASAVDLSFTLKVTRA